MSTSNRTMYDLFRRYKQIEYLLKFTSCEESYVCIRKENTRKWNTWKYMFDQQKIKWKDIKDGYNKGKSLRLYNLTFPKDTWKLIQGEKTNILGIKFLKEFLQSEENKMIGAIQDFIHVLQPRKEEGKISWFLNNRPAIEIKDATRPIHGKGVVALQDLPAGTCIPFLGILEKEIKKEKIKDSEDYNLVIENQTLWCSPETEAVHAYKNAFIGARINEPLMAPLDFIVWVANKLPLQMDQQIKFLRETTMNDLLTTVYKSCVHYIRMLPLLFQEQHMFGVLREFTSVQERVLYFLRLVMVAKGEMEEAKTSLSDWLEELKGKKNIERKNPLLWKICFVLNNNKTRFDINSDKNRIDKDWPSEASNQLRILNVIRQEIDTPHVIYKVEQDGWYWVGSPHQVLFNYAQQNVNIRDINQNIDKYIFVETNSRRKYKGSRTSKITNVFSVRKSDNGLYIVTARLVRQIRKERIGILFTKKPCLTLTQWQQIKYMHPQRLFFYQGDPETLYKPYVPNAHFVEQKNSFMKGIKEIDCSVCFKKKTTEYKIPFEYIVLLRKVKKGEFITVNYNKGSERERRFTHIMKKMRLRYPRMFEKIESFRDTHNLDVEYANATRDSTFKQILHRAYKEMGDTTFAEEYKKFKAVEDDTLLPEYMTSCNDIMNWKQTYSENLHGKINRYSSTDVSAAKKIYTIERNRVVFKRKRSSGSSSQSLKGGGSVDLANIDVIVYLFPEKGLPIDNLTFHLNETKKECPKYYISLLNEMFKERIGEEGMVTLYMNGANMDGEIKQLLTCYVSDEENGAETTTLENTLSQMGKKLMARCSHKLSIDGIENESYTRGFGMFLSANKIYNVFGEKDLVIFTFEVRS